MGRPKLSDLSCTICNLKFKKKNLLDEHMENHLSSRQPRKHVKNYCYVCRKSFDPDKYKVHIETEHKFDLHKMNNNKADDLFSCENGFVLLSKRKIKKDTDSSEQKLATVEKNKSLVSVTDIKIEPIDKVNEEFDFEDHQETKRQKPIQKNILKVKMLKLKCSICGMVCKGRKGLKIHMSAHKRSQNKNYDDASANENENMEDSNEAVNYSQFQNQSNNFNIGKNPNNVLNFENTNSSFMNSTNQSNAQFLQSIPKHFSDAIPKFDCNSEKYMKWLKKFVSKCKMHNYPLNLELCRKVSHVTNEITTALGNPQSFLKHKANHFYFMRMYNILSEIMLNHLQYQLCGTNK